MILTLVKLSSTFLLNSAVVFVNLLNFDYIFFLFGYDEILKVLKLFFKFAILSLFPYMRLSFDLNIFSVYYRCLLIVYWGWIDVFCYDITGTFTLYEDLSLFKVTKIDFLFEYDPPKDISLLTEFVILIILYVVYKGFHSCLDYTYLFLFKSIKFPKLFDCLLFLDSDKGFNVCVLCIF